MATIRKSGNGWQALIRRRGHQGPKSKTFASRRHAELWAQALEQTLRPQTSGVPKAPQTLAEAIEAYVAGPLQKHRSALNEAYPLLATASSWIGGIPLEELSIQHLAAWRDQRLETVQPNTVMRELRNLRVLMDWCREERGAPLRGNPARGLRVKGQGDGRIAHLSRQEEQRLLEALKQRQDPQHLLLTQLALATAMRRSELLALRWEEIDLERKVARITRKGCAATGYRQAERVVPLGKHAIALLRANAKASGRVLELTSCSARSGFERARREAGLPELRFHDLRHVAISRLWSEGMNALEISATSGHRDLKMLMRYSHFSPS